MTVPIFHAPRAGLLGVDSVRLDGPEGRHAVSVRRLTAGEQIVLTDGAGLAVSAVVTGTEGKDVLHASVLERSEHPAARPHVTVVQALPKGDRGELAVELLTEVGVDRIVPWQASRCVARWKGERGDKALRRWRATAFAAAKQSRRVWFPEVTAAAGTTEVVEILAAAEFAVVLHESAEPAWLGAPPATAGEVVVVVGPEGGIAPDELAAFIEAGALVSRMGSTVLRTSTAGVVAVAALLSQTARWT